MVPTASDPPAPRGFDPNLEFPCEPAACELPSYEAGHKKPPANMLEPEGSPCIYRASTHERQP